MGVLELSWAVLAHLWSSCILGLSLAVLGYVRTILRFLGLALCLSWVLFEPGMALPWTFPKSSEIVPNIIEAHRGVPPPKGPQQCVRPTQDLAKSGTKSLGKSLRERYLLSLTFAVQNSSLRSET